MKEQRRDPRFPVRFSSSFSSVNRLQGEGEVVDLSVRGCRVRSDAAVQVGAEVQLDVRCDEPGGPLRIARAAIRWAQRAEFGVEFLDMADAEWKRLCAVVKKLESRPSGPPPGTT